MPCPPLALLLLAAPLPAGELPYSVPAQPWPEALGKHRARVRVEAPAEAVRLHLPWRRRDEHPEAKRIVIVDAATGKTLRNVVAVHLEREYSDLAFQPETAPGDYFVYYLPYVVQDNWGWYGGDYLKPEETADPAWRQKALADPAQLPEAQPLEIQARTEFSRCDPMEVIATAAETQALLAAHLEPYLLFAEDRRYPTRMTSDLPLRWIHSGPGGAFRGEAERDEYYAFQIGVFAARQKLDDLKVGFADLRGPGSIPAAGFTCFNLGGTDWTGDPLTKRVDVAAGRVQALWMGVMIPRNAKPGVYRGVVTVTPANAPATTVPLEITVADRVAAEHGDNELWRHSRLRWLDSTVASDDELTPPYTPLKLKGRAIGCLGRTLRFGDDGLPAGIAAGRAELLAAPFDFAVTTAKGRVAWGSVRPRVAKQVPGAVEWTAERRAEGLALSTAARMEYDGHITWRLTLRAEQAASLRDVALEMPFRREAVPYLMGIGRKGGYRPASHAWKWGGRVYYDSFWLGDVPAGVQCELRGASYCGPMVNLYWNLGQLKPPVTWDNGGQGGVTVADDGADRVLARAFSGPRELAAGESITYEFALLITPVKPLDTAAHFRTRYFHDYQPVEKIAATGANVINIHHANELNPYINYPFLAVDKLSAYVRAAHEREIKVKLYYTLRELTNHTVELSALRSLGHEVLAPGGGGGYPWLREHLGDDYAPSWYQQQPDGEACAAIVNSGTSRWYNYYLEGLGWLVRHAQIDGLYNDDVSYDRRIMKRVRKILDRNRPGCMIDLHSNTGFSHGPANQYMEFFPFIDRLWFGESFNYDDPPDYWLTEICGIPYGLMGDMLQDGGNPWRGMVYGMTVRMPWTGDPTHLWKLWDQFGIGEAKMLGYWDKACPVRTDQPDLKATAYVRKGRTLIALASWSRVPVRCKLTLDWKALGLDPARAHLWAPELKDYQEAALFDPDEAVPVVPRRGWLLWVDEQSHDAPKYVVKPDTAYQNRALLWSEPFAGDRLAAEWTPVLSKVANTGVAVLDGAFRIHAQGHVLAYAERALPAGVTLAQCKVDPGSDLGMSWGVGLELLWPERMARVNVRATEGRFGTDDGKEQGLHRSFAAPGLPVWLRIRMESEQMVAEVSADGAWWEVLKTWPRASYPGDPVAIRVGKMSGGLVTQDAGQAEQEGDCQVSEVRVYQPK